jgi:flagellar assembly factor FliW
MTHPAPSMIQIPSDLLGPLTVGDDEIYAFATGIFGFPECRRFVLVDGGREGLYWLQSAEQASLAFLLVDPFHYQPGYEADLPDADLAHIGVASPESLLVLTIVTLAKPLQSCTVNLQAPIAFNTQTRQARQVVLAGDRYSVRAPLFLGGIGTPEPAA